MKLDETKRQKIVHPIPPLYDKDSKILILGSFPSVKSREEAFFYGHPQNRFWKLLAGIFSENKPETIEEKREFLHKNHVAVWDVSTVVILLVHRIAVFVTWFRMIYLKY